MPPTPTATVTKPAPAAKKKATPAPAAKPAAPPAVTVPTPPPTPLQSVAEPVNKPRAVVYDKVTADEYSKDSDLGPITEEIAKAALEWEDEKAYKLRCVEENPGTKPDHWEYKEDFLLKDKDGNKVRCWNNLDNRWLDLKWSEGLAQTILNGDWAGPTTMPGETVNGSTIVISRTGKVESGQHSLIGLILACQMFRANKEQYPFWNNLGIDPVIETILITGISEHPKVTQSHDNIKQRSPADVFFTSPIFQAAPRNDRDRYSRMMAAGADLLWKRTNAQGYATLPEIVSFVDRHKKLIKAVEHIFTENTDKPGVGNVARKIEVKIMSAGQAAAVCYLMGCSAPATDGDVYRNGFPPTEKDLDWSLWGKAKEFWALVASHEDFQPVRRALNRLNQTTIDGANGTVQGMGGTSAEKLAILCKAWRVWVNHDASTGAPMFSEADLNEGGALWLAYNDLDADGKKLPDGKLTFLDHADFEGIDVPEDMKGKNTRSDPPVAPSDVEAAKVEAMKNRIGAPPSQKAIDTAAKLKALRDAKEKNGKK